MPNYVGHILKVLINEAIKMILKKHEYVVDFTVGSEESRSRIQSLLYQHRERKLKKSFKSPDKGGADRGISYEIEVNGVKESVKLKQSVVSFSADTLYAVIDNGEKATLGVGKSGKVKKVSQVIEMRSEQMGIIPGDAKAIKREAFNGSKDTAMDTFHARVEREVTATQKVYPSNFHSPAFFANKSYTVLERQSGEVLDKVFRSYDISKIMQFMQEGFSIVTRIRETHQMEHGDMHLGNFIVLDENGDLKIIDFGNAVYKKEVSLNTWNEAIIKDYLKFVVSVVYKLTTDQENDKKDVRQRIQEKIQIYQNKNPNLQKQLEAVFNDSVLATKFTKFIADANNYLSLKETDDKKNELFEKLLQTVADLCATDNMHTMTL